MDLFRNIEYDYKTEDDAFIARGLQLNEIVDVINSGSGIGLYTLYTVAEINYTFVLGDANKLVVHKSAGSGNWTIPPNSSVEFEIGTRIRIADASGNQCNVSAGSGVTLYVKSSHGAVIAYGVGEIIKIGTNTWMLTGDTAAAA